MTIRRGPEAQAGEGKRTRGLWYLHNGLFVGAVQLDLMKHLQEVLGLHPNSVKKTPTPQ